MLLEVRGLRSGYGPAEILHGIDLRVPAGCTVALLGANGAGKTTLLKTIAGLLPTRSGEILLRGRSMERLPAHSRARAGVCLIPEGRGVFRHLTVRENLLVQAGRRDQQVTVEKAASLFPVLGRRLAQEAGRLSGGEQQMLALARALVTDSSVVLADELSVGLAPVVVAQIFQALEMVRADGRSVLLVEQYVERAVELASYVYILDRGSVAFVGESARCTSEEVFDRYLGAAP
jgi:branched-chain amino acid transport system ATP-binding protein